MLKLITPIFTIPFLLISCQEKAEVALVPGDQSEEKIAALEGKLQRLEERMISEQNLRHKQDAEQMNVLNELRNLAKDAAKNNFVTKPVAAVVKLVSEAGDKKVKEDSNEEARRLARLQAQGEELDLLVTNTGEPFHEIVINRVTDIGVTFRHKGGIARVSFPNLPVAWQDRFYYDRDRALRALKNEDLAQLRSNKAVSDQMIAMREENEKERRDLSMERLARAVEDLKRPAGIVAPPAANGQIVVNPPIIVHNDLIYHDDVYCPPVIQTPVVRPRVVRTPTSLIPTIRTGNGNSSHRPTPTPRPTPTVQRPVSRATPSPPAVQRSRPTPRKSRPSVQRPTPGPAPQPRTSRPRQATQRSR